MSKLTSPLYSRLFGGLMSLPLKLYGRRTLPRTAGKVSIPGLAGPVEILRDRWGVPHVYAQSAPDLFLAQGFVHAQDRFFQMEMSRRIAAGRLAEMWGEVALGTDRMSRVLGFRRLATADWAVLSSETRQVLEAYAIGVNAFLSGCGSAPGLEFSLLRHVPEPWNPLDTVTLAKMQAWHMSHSWAAELTRARILDKVGPEMASWLDVLYPDMHPAILPGGVDPDALGLSESLRAGLASPLNPPPSQGGAGSNSWVIGPGRTATGAPLLACDMHLELKLPGIWHLCHLEAADGSYRVTGATLAGVPGVIVGHNASIAWGATLGFCDQQDLFVENMRAGPVPTYEHKGQWHTAQVHRETILIRDRATPHVEEVVVTRHGPIVGGTLAGRAPGKLPAPPGTDGQPALALQAVAFEPSQGLSGFLAINRARNWEEFVAGVRLIESPDLSLTYGDTAGNFGYYLTGKVPVRGKGQGMVPAPGWSGEYDWVGRVPFEHMPHALNPKQGFLVTANNRIVGDDYPYFLSSCWMNGYRADRITRRLGELPAATIDDCQALQMDLYSLAGGELIRRLEGLEGRSPDAKLALRLLRDWDRNLTAGSVGGAVFVVLQARLMHAIVEGPLGPELTLEYLGVGSNPVLCPTTEFSGKASLTVLRLLDSPDNPWIRECGGREVLLQRCLEEAVGTLRQLMGNEPAAWQWGNIHRVYWAHPFSSNGVMASVFDRGPFPIGGDTDTVHQSAYFAHRPYDSLSYCPSFRQIVDLADFSRSRVMIPGGQSGHLASRHYDDLIAPWRAGESFPMLWNRGDVDAAVEDRLVLEPGPLGGGEPAGGKGTAGR